MPGRFCGCESEFSSHAANARHRAILNISPQLVRRGSQPTCRSPACETAVEFVPNVRYRSCRMMPSGPCPPWTNTSCHAPGSANTPPTSWSWRLLGKVSRQISAERAGVQPLLCTGFELTSWCLRRSPVSVSDVLRPLRITASASEVCVTIESLG